MPHRVRRRRMDLMTGVAAVETGSRRWRREMVMTGVAVETGS